MASLHPARVRHNIQQRPFSVRRVADRERTRQPMTLWLVWKVQWPCIACGTDRWGL